MKILICLFLYIQYAVQIEDAPNLCDPKDMFACPNYATCCVFANGEHGCCPFPSGICCPDTDFCCPPGFECTKDGCSRVGFA